MLSFQQPAVLLALGALAIPVILHLVNRKPALRWRFPSVRFLKASPLPRQGKRRITDPLLLLLRLLFYALLIALAAGPQWQQSEAAVEEDLPRSWILIDLSASMQGWDAWDEAVARAEASLTETDGPVGLIAFSDRIEQQIELTSDHSSILQAIRNLQPSLYPAEPAAALAAAMNRIERAEDRIVVISDFQRSAWEGVSWPSARAVQLELQAVGQERGGNRVILGAQSYFSSSDSMDVLVQLRNDDSAAATIEVELQVEGRSYRTEVEADPWEVVPASFIIPIPSNPAGQVRIGDDRYALDNEYPVYLGMNPPLRVLALMPPDQTQAAQEEIFFLQTALHTHSSSDSLRYAVDVLGSGMLNPALLETFDAVFVSGSSRESDSGKLALLAEFAEAGGLVFMTLGEAVVPRLRSLRELGIWDLNHGGQVGRERYQGRGDSVGPLSSMSRLRETFSGDAARDLYLSHLHRYVILEDAPVDTVLLRSEAGHPLLLETPVGEGHWLLSAFPIHTRASDLPLRNSFLPLIKELMRIAAPEGGGIERVELSSANADSFPEPGLYMSGERPLLVSVARSESDPQTLDLSAIRRTQQAGAAAAAAVAADDQARSLWQWFALAAVAIFLLESLLSGWLDRPRPARSSAKEAQV